MSPSEAQEASWKGFKSWRMGRSEKLSPGHMTVAPPELTGAAVATAQSWPTRCHRGWGEALEAPPLPEEL